MLANCSDYIGLRNMTNHAAATNGDYVDNVGHDGSDVMRMMLALVWLKGFAGIGVEFCAAGIVAVT